MRVSLANIIRSYSEIVAYNEKSDPLLKKLERKDKAGYPSTPDLINTRIRGWKTQGKPEIVKMFQTVKTHVDGDNMDEALSFYKENIVPALKKEYGRK